MGAVLFSVGVTSLGWVRSSLEWAWTLLGQEWSDLIIVGVTSRVGVASLDKVWSF